jgi:hypothetical protein
MVVGIRKSDGVQLIGCNTNCTFRCRKGSLCLHKQALDYVACIVLLLATNRYLRFLDRSELAMQKRALAHVDYKTRH